MDAKTERKRKVVIHLAATPLEKEHRQMPLEVLMDVAMSMCSGGIMWQHGNIHAELARRLIRAGCEAMIENQGCSFPITFHLRNIHTTPIFKASRN